MDGIGNYKDLLEMQRPESKRYERMPIKNRAAQFAPFAALSGHGAALEERARITEAKRLLSEDAKVMINCVLRELMVDLNERPFVKVNFFRKDFKKEGGTYVDYEGYLKRIDDIEGKLVFVDRQEIVIDDIYAIEYEDGYFIRNGWGI